MIRYLLVLLLVLTSCLPEKIGREDPCTILYNQRQDVIKYHRDGPEKTELLKTIDSLWNGRCDLYIFKQKNR